MMTENVEPEVERRDAPWWKTALFLFFCLSAARILEESFGIHYGAALSASCTAGFLLIYWVPPKPAMSYPKWILYALSFGLAGCLALWLLPELLRHLIWRPLASALPIFLFCVALRYLPPFSEQKKAPFLPWLALTLCFTLLMFVFDYHFYAKTQY